MIACSKRDEDLVTLDLSLAAPADLGAAPAEAAFWVGRATVRCRRRAGLLDVGMTSRG